MGETRGRRKYDREFKEDAIRLILDGGRPVREVARDLGIHENMLHRWKQECMSSNDSDTPLSDDIVFSYYFKLRLPIKSFINSTSLS